MTDRMMFCHKNKTSEKQSFIQNIMDMKQRDVDLIPVFCMKLCFLCHSQYVIALNGSLIVSPNEEKLLMEIERRLDV